MCVCVCVCVCVVCVLVLGPTLGGPRLAPEEPHRLCGAYVCPRSLGLPSHGREQVPAPHLPGPFWALLYPPSPRSLLGPTPSPISPVPAGPYSTLHLPGSCWTLPHPPSPRSLLGPTPRPISPVPAGPSPTPHPWSWPRQAAVRPGLPAGFTSCSSRCAARLCRGCCVCLPAHPGNRTCT